MTDSTYSSKALRADSNAAGATLLRELFAATPLAIFIDALNGKPATPRSTRR